MILGFSTQINGKETNFVSKIWTSLYKLYEKEDGKKFMPKLYYDCLDKGFKNMHPHNPKLQSIREDKKNRWKAGNKIDFFINVRKKNMFRFAPVLPVVSIQKFQIIYNPESIFFKSSYPASIYVDKRKLQVNEIPEFTKNDGFDTIEDFFAYFDKDFTGKIIHWTNLRY